MRRPTRLAILLVSSTLVFACGGGDDDDDNTPDASINVPDAPVSIDAPQQADAPPGTPDAAPRPDSPPAPDADTTDADTTDADTTNDADLTDAGESAACQEFLTPDGTISSYPGSFNGDINDASASQIVAVSTGDCAVENAPDGVVTPGAEQVITLTNLTAGDTYVVTLTAAEDLGFYVATSCTGDDGPAAGECLVYVDTTAIPEVGTFTQPTFVAPTAGVAYVVVDRWYSSAPTDGTYTLDVIVAECTSSFDCTDPAAPVCDPATYACVAGAGDCVGDDTVEEDDDGQVGATTLTLGTPISANVCNTPATETDWYVFTAPGDENVRVALEWTGGPAGEMYAMLYEGDGTPYGYIGGDTSPVGATIPHAAAGNYYVEVFRYGTEDTAVTPYTLSATVIECFWPGADCTTAGSPVCGVDFTCGASTANTCTGDDAAEDDDDGAGLATVLTPTLDGAAADVTAHICSAPTSGGYSIESDFYAVTIGANEVLTVTLGWTGDDDIDLFIYDSNGAYVGDSATYDNPEVYTSSTLEAGTYFIEAWTYDPADVTVSTEYSLSVQRASGS